MTTTLLTICDQNPKIPTIHEANNSSSSPQPSRPDLGSPNSSEYYSSASSVSTTTGAHSVLSPSLAPLSFPNRSASIPATNAGSPVASLLSNTNKSIYLLFNKVWHLLVEMQSDPYPDVAEFAHKVVSFFVARAHCFDRLKQNTILQQQLQPNISSHARQFSSDLTNRSAARDGYWGRF